MPFRRRLLMRLHARPVGFVGVRADDATVVFLFLVNAFVMGKVFAPGDPLWGAMTDARRGGSHLFLRYSFPRTWPSP